MKLALADNPVRIIRKEKALTQQEFADLCKITVQMVYMVESGTYIDIPSSIMSKLVSEDHPEYSIRSQYQTFIAATRANTASLYDWETQPVGYTLDTAPFQQYREHFNLSRQSVSKLLCVQTAKLYKLETGQTKKLPGQLVDALGSVGVPWRNIALLNTWTEKFYWKEN